MLLLITAVASALANDAISAEGKADPNPNHQRDAYGYRAEAQSLRDACRYDDALTVLHRALKAGPESISDPIERRLFQEDTQRDVDAWKREQARSLAFAEAIRQRIAAGDPRGALNSLTNAMATGGRPRGSGPDTGDEGCEMASHRELAVSAREKIGEALAAARKAAELQDLEARLEALKAVALMDRQQPGLLGVINNLGSQIRAARAQSVRRAGKRIFWTAFWGTAAYFGSWEAYRQATKRRAGLNGGFSGR